MVDWDSLKSLRTHRNIMTFVVIGLLGIMIYNFVKKGSNKSRSSNQSSVVGTIVNSKSGLNIREEANKNSKTLVSVPYKESIIILDKNGSKDYINGQYGVWYKVEYQGTIGYAWSILISE